MTRRTCLLKVGPVDASKMTCLIQLLTSASDSETLNE